MRVIHVVTAWPRQAEDPITPWLVELVRRQQAEGLEASVLAPAYRGGPAAEPTNLPVQRFRYAPAPLETLTHDETVPDRLRRSPLHGLLVPPYLLGGALAAWRVGRRTAPDVVHVHWPMPHAVFGAALRRGSGGRTAVVSSYYSVEIHWIRERLPLLLPLLRWTARTADEITAISNSTAAAIRSLVDRPISVIPYGAALADDGSRPARQALSGLPDEPVRVLFVGRLVERKGVEVLVQAIAEARGTFARPVELRIVGTGEWQPRIAAAIQAAGLGAPATEGRSEGAIDPHADRHPKPDRSATRAVLLGRVSDADLRREYEAADVFVLPAVRDAKGDTEGLGVVLLEALRFERPVVGSDIGGIPDVIRHGDTGLLCPPGQPRALAAAIDELIRDPDRARDLARRGRLRAAEAFGWDGVLAATTAAYHRAIDNRSAGP